MFLKQTSYKPRGSQDASRDNGQSDSVQGGTGATSTPANNGQRRKSSSSSDNGAYAGLMSHKRANSGDEAGAGLAARKASWAEMKPGSGGMFSGMWSNFTKGNGK